MSNKLTELHSKLSTVLKEGLETPESCTPTFLNVVRQFLKDNHVEELPVAETPFGDLVDVPMFDDDNIYQIK